MSGSRPVNVGKAIPSWRSNLTIAWGIGVVDVLAAAACTLLYALNQGNAFTLLTTLAFGLLPLSGAVIISRQPRNPVGWLAASVGFIFVVGDLLNQYGTYALITHPGVLPLGGLAVWVSAWFWMAVYSLAIPFLLLIPNGRLLSKRWRALIWAGVVTGLPMVALMASYSAPVDKVFLLKSQNFLPQNGPTSGIQIWQVMNVWMVLQFFMVLLAAIGLFVRFRRSQGIERQQLKWMFLAITTIPVAVGLGLLSGENNNTLLNDAYQVVNFLSACSFPVALTFAVTRYRLYDIDVIIRRTLVYSLLTFILGLLYFCSVLLFQEAFTLVIGQKSPVSIVLSTLFIAGAFSPLRQRIQVVIDRRFFRTKLDADHMLEQFAARQRESLDLEQFNAEFLRLIEETLHPEQVSLCLVRTAEPLKEHLTSHS